MWLLMPICVVLHPTLKLSSLLLDVDWRKTNYNWKLNSLIFSIQEIWSPSFLLVTSLISIRTMYFNLDEIPTLSPTLNLFGFTYPCEPFFSKKKHAKKILHSQLSNDPLTDLLFLSTFPFNPNITSFLWLEISLINYNCYLVNSTCFFLGGGLSIYDFSRKAS